LQNGDTVSCLVTVDTALLCATSNTTLSNKLVVSVANVAPSVTITSSANNVCEGTNITFSATFTNAGNTPAYQWKVNGVNVGGNSPVYSTKNLNNGDIVVSMITSSGSPCGAAGIGSNIITMVMKSLPIIVITSDSTRVVSGGHVQLKATISGTLNIFNWSPATLLVDPLILSPTTKPLTTTTTFSLNAVSNEGCRSSASITIQLPLPFLMPSAFTPNGDGKNDLFRIPPGAGIMLSDFSIYDRWGNKIFTTKDAAKGWNGKMKDVPLQSGAFVYTISGMVNDKPVQLKGSFVLVR
jgi:gliding motility-associated-like protein